MESEHDELGCFIALVAMAVFLFGLFQCGIKKPTTFPTPPAWSAATSRMDLDYLASLGDKKLQDLPKDEQKPASDTLEKLRHIRPNLSVEDGKDLELIKFVEMEHIRLQSGKAGPAVRLKEARQLFTNLHAVCDRHTK